MSKNTSFFGFFLEKPLILYTGQRPAMLGKISGFSRKKPKNDVFFDITKPPLAQIYPKSGL